MRAARITARTSKEASMATKGRPATKGVARQEVTCRMPAPLANAVRARAKALECSVNDYVVGLIAADLAKQESPDAHGARRILAALLTELGRSSMEEVAKAS